MMDCRRFKAELRRIGAGALPSDLHRHAESCRSCELELRTSRLLSLGSSLIEGAPRSGFPQRLGARLRAEGSPVPAGWFDAIGLVARPAFGLALAAVLLSVAAYSAAPSATGKDDLVLLAEQHPVVSALLSGGRGGLLGLPEQR